MQPSDCNCLHAFSCMWSVRVRLYCVDPGSRSLQASGAGDTMALWCSHDQAPAGHLTPQ
jgi:hypothetical protein